MIVRVLGKEVQLIRVSDDKGTGNKRKYKRRIVLWCIKDGEYPWKSLFRVLCRGEDVSGANIGSVLCLCNYIVAATYQENEIPVANCSKYVTERFQHHLYLPISLCILHGGTVLEQDLTLFSASM
jgi:hypothetical protein